MIQLQALNKVLIDGSLSILINNDIDSSYFPEYLDEYNFIKKHYDKYGNVPDELSVLEKFEGFELIEINESDAYIIDTLREEWTYRSAAPIMNEAAKLMQIDSAQAMEYAIPELQKLLQKTTFSSGVDIAQTAKERYDWSLSLKDTPDLLGVTSGFEEVDEVIGGMLPGEELIIVLGRPNEGKSWTLLKMLSSVWDDGKTVLLYSGEMGARQVGTRFDTLVSNISNNAITRGELAGSFLTKYEEHTEIVSDDGTKFIVITPEDLGGKFLTPMTLDSLIQKYKPDVVGLDQLSLMDIEDSGKGYRVDVKTKYSSITKDLFNLSSKHGVPIVLAAQATRDSENRDKRLPELRDIAESDTVGQNASRVIALAEEDGLVTYKLVKNRYGAKDVMFEYFWDKDTGSYVYAGDGKDDEDEENPNERVRNLRLKTSKRNSEVRNAVQDSIKSF